MRFKPLLICITANIYSSRHNTWVAINNCVIQKYVSVWFCVSLTVSWLCFVTQMIQILLIDQQVKNIISCFGSVTALVA